MVPEECRLILFGRYPAAGGVKTCLIGRLGALGAAEVHRLLSEKTLDTLLAARLGKVCFCYCGGSPARMRRWLGRRRVEIQPQAAGDLGRRMQHALEQALDRGARRAILTGTDIPDLNARILGRACAALADHDLVLGPGLDGGYYLVGLRRRAPVFEGIHWGTPHVLAATLDAARRHGLSVGLLPPLGDVDRPADLARIPPEWRSVPYLSIVIPALNESAMIGATLAQFAGRAADVEIIVADGGSRDDTAAQARRAGARVIVAPPGRAAQQNAGAAAALGRVLLFLHADTRLPADYGAQVFEALIDAGACLGAFRFKTDDDRRGMRLIETMVGLRTRLLGLPYGDQALFLRKAVFEHLNGFPYVPIAEDLLLVRKALKTGRLALAPGSALTSARRWRALGLVRTTLINYTIAAGCMLGVAPSRLAPLYRRGGQRSAASRTPKNTPSL